VSYPALLSSLNRTVKGDQDDWRTVMGTLVRQSFNGSGKLVSANQLVRDLRSVGWGGRRQEVLRAYKVMLQVLKMSVLRTSQERADLDSFNRPPPAGWKKAERSNTDRWVSHAVVVVTYSGDLTQSPLLRLWGSNTKRLPSVFGALSDIRMAYDQGLEDTDYEGENVVTYEYAGVRHLVKTVTSRRAPRTRKPKR